MFTLLFQVRQQQRVARRYRPPPVLASKWGRAWVAEVKFMTNTSCEWLPIWNGMRLVSSALNATSSWMKSALVLCEMVNAVMFALLRQLQHHHEWMWCEPRMGFGWWLMRFLTGHTTHELYNNFTSNTDLSFFFVLQAWFFAKTTMSGKGFIFYTTGAIKAANPGWALVTTI